MHVPAHTTTPTSNRAPVAPGRRRARALDPGPNLQSFRIHKVGFLVGALLLGCGALLLGCDGETGDSQLDDGASESFLTTGKADGGGLEEGSPDALGLLAFVNAASLELLKSPVSAGGVGLTARAASNIVAYRAGDDGTIGTDDDRHFRTLAELDAIPYVGPVAFEKLLAAYRRTLGPDAPSECDPTRDGDCDASCGTTAELCADIDAACGSHVVTDACGSARSVTCGTCTGETSCGAGGAVGQCGVHGVYDLGQTVGQGVHVSPRFFPPASTLAMGVVGPNDVWIGGSGVIVRVSGGVSTPYWYDPSLGDVYALHVTGPHEAWALADKGLMRFSAGAWRVVDAGFTGHRLDWSAIAGSSNDLFVAAHGSLGAQLRHFDGQVWRAWPIPASSSHRIHDLFVRERGKPWVVQAGVHRWTGLSWTSLPHLFAHYWKHQPTRLWVSPSGTPFALTLNAVDNAWASLHRYDGSAWVKLFEKSALHRSSCNTFGRDVQGTWDDDVWFADCETNLYRYDGHTVQGVPNVGFSVAAGDSGPIHVIDDGTVYERVGGDFVKRFDRGPFTKCKPGAVDGAGQLWLVCDQALWSLGPHGLRDEGLSNVALTHVAPGSSLWVVRTDGVIERRPAVGEPTIHDAFRGTAFASLAVVQDDNVWAITRDGGAVHWDGRAWQTSRIPFTNAEKPVGLVVSATQTWAWHAGDGPFQFVGGQWRPLRTMPGGDQFSSFRVYLAGDDVWLVGYVSSGWSGRARAWVRDGERWTLRIRERDGIWGIEGSTDGLTVVTGNQAERIEHWTRTQETTLARFSRVSECAWYVFRVPGEVVCGGNNKLGSEYSTLIQYRL